MSNEPTRAEAEIRGQAAGDQFPAKLQELPAGPWQPLELPAPPGLRGTRFSLGGDQFAVLSYPLLERPHLAGLTRAEAEVVTLVLRGQSNAAIARERGVSERTIANQLASTYRKLGVSSRAELARKLAQRRENEDK